MSIDNVSSGKLVSPDGQAISSSDDTDVKMTVEQWDEVKDKLQRCDLYRVVLTALSRGRGKKFLKIPIKALREAEAMQFGLTFTDDGKDMIFVAVDPPGGEHSIN